MIKSNDLKIILLCPLQHFWSRSATGVKYLERERILKPWNE